MVNSIQNQSLSSFGKASVVYQQYAGAFTLVVGVVFLVGSLARLGSIMHFLRYYSKTLQFIR